jgi:putative lipase involved disintegration of autophagic bodies
MTLKESMDRLIWRFSKGQFTPNKNDIEALKNIAEWINRQKEQDLKSNYLLAKVYTYALNNELIFYKNLEFSNKKLQEVCKQPLETHLNTFLSTLNIQSMVEYQENKNISLKHPLSRNEKEENGKNG